MSTSPTNNEVLETTYTKKDPFEQIKPWSVSLGYGFMLTKRITLSFDIIHISKISGNDTPYQKRVVNYRAGIEVYPTDNVIICTGFYTDLTQQPKLDSSDIPWTRRMNYYCGTAGIAFTLDAGTNEVWTDMGCTVKYGTGDIKDLTFAPGTGNMIFHTKKMISWNVQVFMAETLHF